jgi:hypothetical protein
MSRDTLHTVFSATSLLDVHCNGCSHRAILREDELAKPLQRPCSGRSSSGARSAARNVQVNNPRSVFRSMTVRPKLSTGPQYQGAGEHVTATRKQARVQPDNRASLNAGKTQHLIGVRR